MQTFYGQGIYVGIEKALMLSKTLITRIEIVQLFCFDVQQLQNFITGNYLNFKFWLVEKS